MGPLDQPEEAEGAAYESLFYQELRAINAYCNTGYDLYYWRTSNETEVDFVAYGPRGILAFEIKRSRKIDSKDLRGLKSFLADYPMAKAYCVYGGERQEVIQGITCMPMASILKKLPEIL